MNAVAWVTNRAGIVERIEIDADDRRTGAAMACLRQRGVFACFRPADRLSMPQPDAMDKRLEAWLETSPGGLT